MEYNYRAVTRLHTFNFDRRLRIQLVRCTIIVYVFLSQQVLLFDINIDLVEKIH